MVEHRFRVMGSAAHVVVVGDADLVEHAVRRLHQLDAAWTRFQPTSEVSRLNASGGRTVTVSADTYALVARSIDGWRLTEGRFDPTVLGSIVAAGYDRPLDEDGHSGNAQPGAQPAPGCGRILLGRDTLTVTLPEGTHLDAGGIGKGLAADIVAVELLELGAQGALVNIGGDLRAAGTPPTDDGWIVAVKDPFEPAGTIALPRLEAGAVATSTPDHRRWRTLGGPGRHIIDPSTGLGATTDVASATVFAAHAWMAESFAKAAALVGFERSVDLIDDAGLSGLVISDTGDLSLSARMGAFL